MIKLSMFALVSMIATSASYAVTVGDSAVLGCTATQGGLTVPFTVTNEVLAIDEASNTLTVLANTSIQGQTQSNTSTASLSEYRSYEAATASIEAACSGVGSLTPVVTPAGTFTTCKFSTNINGQPASVYLANVPFSIVKLETDNGQMSCTLQSYKKN